jgi:hypothetical protein
MPAKSKFIERVSNIKPAGSINSVWETATYDVWGNAKDGWEVNNTFRGGEIELRIPQTRFNAGMKGEFLGASPTDKQIRQVFNLGTTQIETDGDDIHITVNRKRDGYPLGEMRCISHDSLSPIKPKASEPESEMTPEERAERVSELLTRKSGSK